MIYDVPAAAAEIAQRQSGAISRRQLLDAGLTSQMIMTRLERGRWQALHRGVYAVFTRPARRETWLWAAVLRAGPGAVLSHLSAAELHGLLDAPAEAIFVTVPATRRVSTPGIVIRTCGRIGEATQPGREPPRTSVEETVLDLTQLASTFDDACGWITRACGRRLTTGERLRAALAVRGKMRWRAGLGDVLAAAGDGIHSVLEYRYLRDVERAHGLPRSRHQVRVVIDGPAGTTRPAPAAWRPPATADATSTATPARPPCCRRRSCGSAAGPGPRGHVPGTARWAASGQAPRQRGLRRDAGSGRPDRFAGFMTIASTTTAGFASQQVRLGESGTPSLVCCPHPPCIPGRCDGVD